MNWGMDFSDMNPADIEASQHTPPGWYRCELEDVEEDLQGGGMKIKFRVAQGPHKGAVLRDYVTPPDHGRDVQASIKLKQRVAMYFKRLGGMRDEDFTGVVELDWTTLVGADCYVRIIEDTYSPNEGEKRTRYKPAFDGIYAADDPRAEPNKKAAASASTKSKAVKGKGGDDEGEDSQPAKAAAPKPPGKPGGGKKSKYDTTNL